jgi:hypothetical protein
LLIFDRPGRSSNEFDESFIYGLIFCQTTQID